MLPEVVVSKEAVSDQPKVGAAADQLVAEEASETVGTTALEALS
jgi:hypothetical protein